MKEEDLRRIGLYAGRLAAAAGDISVLTDVETRHLHDLLKEWLDEQEESIAVRVPASWGDVRRQYKA